MNYVELAFQLFESSRDDVIVQSESAHRADHFVRDAHFPSREGWLNPYCGRKRPMDGTRKNGNFGAGVDEAFNLLPSGVADAAGADLVRETVKNSDALRVWFRLHIRV